MIIRSAQASDAAEIVALWNPFIRDTSVTFNSIEKTQCDLVVDIETKEKNGRAFFLAEQQGSVIGFATYGQFRNGIGYAHTMEHTVILSPDAHGGGVGRALMTAIEDHARATGAHSMMAGVSAENGAGVAFHKAVGYEHVGHVKQAGFKFGRWMDLILLQKML